jgi:3-oxoacyl-[acyl-carrier-protein] synthase II
MPSRKTVITGLGIVSPIGIGCDTYFQALLRQDSGVRSLSERDDGGAKPSGPESLCGPLAGLWIGAPVLDFDPKQFVRPRKALKVMCREIQTAFASSQMAMEQAGLADLLPASDTSPIAPSRIGTVFGGEMYYGPPEDMIEPIQECLDDNNEVVTGKFGAAARRGVMPLWMLKYLPNMPACHIGISVNAHGPNNSLVQGDVSGPSAMMEAVSYIGRGLCDVVLTGATGTLINSTRLSYRNDRPLASVCDPIASSSRPHDAKSTGVVGGEGACAVVVESEESAKRRDAKVVAQIAGAASRFAPASLFSKQPRRSAVQYGAATGDAGRGSADAIRLAIDAALGQAEIDASGIGLVVSHASGDREMDAAEQVALKDDLQSVPMIAPMASIGHTGAASGSIAIVTGAAVIQSGVIPPTLNAATSNGAALLTEATDLVKDYVLCLAHTPEGIATAVVLRRV